jgi:hypothetical protein
MNTAEMIVRDVCELDPPEPAGNIIVSADDLLRIVKRYITPDGARESMDAFIERTTGRPPALSLDGETNTRRWVPMHAEAARMAAGSDMSDMPAPDLGRIARDVGDLLDKHLPEGSPKRAAVAINHQGVVLDRGYPWRPMLTCPQGAKVQLLGGGGVAYYGTWNGRDPWPKRWAPLPKLVDGPI